MTLPLLLVLAGRAGTGKTTLSRRLAVTLRAAVVRIDAIEAAVVRCGLATHPVGVVGYVAASEIARATLAAGTPVIIDAVNPVAEARAGWRDLAAGRARLVIIETVLTDAVEHRRRVTARAADLEGQRLPSWDDVCAADYLDWDEVRDGPRTVIDTADAAGAYDRAFALCVDTARARSAD